MLPLLSAGIFHGQGQSVFPGKDRLMLGPVIFKDPANVLQHRKEKDHRDEEEHADAAVDQVKQDRRTHRM